MKKIFIPVITTLFIAINLAIYLLSRYAPAFQQGALAAGNCVMAILSLLSFMMIASRDSKDPHSFVRRVSGASFLKLMVCMTGILIYVLILRPNVHKPTIFVLLGIYILYTATERIILSKWARAEK